MADCFKDATTFSSAQLALLCYFLDEIIWRSYLLAQHFNCRLYGLGIIPVQFVQVAAEQLNIRFSAPLETQYHFQPLGRELFLRAFQGRLTLRDLACMHPEFVDSSEQFLYPRRYGSDHLDHHIAAVRALSHKELVQKVEESISNWIKRVNLGSY